MSTFIINVRQKPYYNGTRTLDGNTYKLSFYWNLTTEKWYLGIKGLNNDIDTHGIACMVGKNLLAPFGYVELGELWVVDNSGAEEDPNYEEFGSRWTLEYTEV